MPVINSSDLDARMGQHVNPNTVPRFDGTGQGAMQAVIRAGSEQHHQGAHIAREGAAVYNARDLPGGSVGERGGTTVISVNDAPPLLDQHDPAVIAAKARATPVQVNKPLPAPKPQPVAASAPVAPPKPAPAPPGKAITFPTPVKPPVAPKPAPAVIIDPNGATAKLMAQLGLKPAKK